MPTKNVYNPSDHVTKVILTATRASPGIRTDALASETSLCESTISTAGRILVERGLLRREKKGRYYHYYPAGAEDVREPQQLFLSSDPLLKAEIDALKAEIDALEDEIDTLEDEVSELRAFKTRALAAYPDFEVDPIVLAAREIGYRALKDEGKNDVADRVVTGNADDTAFVRAIVEALKLAKKAED
jgi:predicted transcriptional regulator